MTQDEEEAHKLAIASLLLDTPPPVKGPRPTLEELWDWMHDAIDENRAAEIRTHVARNSDVAEEWRELRLVLDEMQSESHPATNEKQPTLLNKISEWLGNLQSPPLIGQFGGTLAGIALVGFSLLLLLKVYDPAQEPISETPFWQDWQVSKTAQTSPYDEATLVAMKTLLYGMRLKMLEQSIKPVTAQGQPLPTEPMNCQNDSLCIKTRDSLVELGQLAVSDYQLCQTGKPPSDANHQNLQNILDTLENNPSAAPLQAPLKRWLFAESPESDTELDSEVRCSSVATLIARALNGMPDTP